MTRWSIEVAVARAMLDAAAVDAADLDTGAAELGAALDVASGAAGGGPTSAALARLAVDPFAVDIATARSRAANAVSGVRQAVAFYEAGDEEMAANTQRAMQQL